MQTNTPDYYEERKKEYDRKVVYSGFGWFLFTVIGMSAKPKRVEFYNKETGELAASFTDNDTRKKYIGR